eukprot:748789-Hanusia_phi.AAC.2
MEGKEAAMSTESSMKEGSSPQIYRPSRKDERGRGREKDASFKFLPDGRPSSGSSPPLVFLARRQQWRDFESCPRGAGDLCVLVSRRSLPSSSTARRSRASLLARASSAPEVTKRCSPVLLSARTSKLQGAQEFKEQMMQ